MSQSRLRSLLAGFLTVGGLGFIVDAGVFQVLYQFGQGPIATRVISATLSISVTWYLNRHFVFQTSDVNASVPEYTRYVSVQFVGLVVNFGVYLALLASFPVFQAQPILALCGGAAAALVLNFLGARYLAFRTN